MILKANSSMEGISSSVTLSVMQIESQCCACIIFALICVKNTCTHYFCRVFDIS